MKKSFTWFIALPFALFAGCTATESILDDDGNPASGGNGGGTTSGGDATGGGLVVGVGVGGSTGSSGPCNTDPTVDDDGDGFSEDEGDCNDCDPNVNPDAIEVIGSPSEGGGGMGGYEPADENCNNEIDEPPVLCDSNLGLNDVNAMSGAKAIDICHVAGNGQGWGVVSANYVRANGGVDPTPDRAVGLVPSFGGFAVQKGNTMLGLSSGFVRPAGHPEACGAAFPNTSCNHNNAGTAPPNFPQDVPSCSGSNSIYDDIALELEIKAPSNARGYSFDFAFMSFEFPEWVCTSYNDQFIALVNPAPMGSINGNISFDSQTNPVSVNIALFDYCDATKMSYFAQNCFGSCPAPPNPYCPSGHQIMNGTGFNEWDTLTGSGSTGWLVTTAPVDPGATFKIRFAIWDTGDGSLDSTVLIDNFQWKAEAGTVVVGTEPVPDPT